MVVGEFTQETDLAVIGGGPGGYVAAFRAAELGLNTVIIDQREQLGGMCLHAGCIPSKTLLYIADAIRLADHASIFGIQYQKPAIDFEKIRDWVNQSVNKLAKGLAGRANSLDVERINGIAQFEDDRHLVIQGKDSSGIQRIRFRRVVIATGARAMPHPAAAFDEQLVWTPGQALELPEIPKSLLVIGNNYRAVELASIYAALGSTVTLLTEEDHLLPQADRDLVRPFERTFRSHVAHVELSNRISKLECGDGKVTAILEINAESSSFHADRAIVCCSNRGNLDGLELDRAHVTATKDGYLSVDEQLRTCNPRIFAVGDVTGPPLLADRAMAQGRIVAEVIAGWNSAHEPRAVPMVVFTDPQLAWCGLTEQAAGEQEIPIAVLKLPWGASGRAIGIGRTDGLTKIIYEPDTQLVLGVGICGTGAAELIGEGALAIEMGAELDDLAMTIHPHPTTAELISEAAKQK